MENKQVGIIGAGISGLLACKYCLAKGFNPMVFESEADVGGVWLKTIKTTSLQDPKAFFQFSDYPWPDSVTDDFPTQQQTLDYIHSYAVHFNLITHVKFHSRVTGINFETSPFLNGNGKWNVIVDNAQTATTQVYNVDFVILCLGRFKDVPNMPEFVAGKGPEVFQGQVIHSMEYAAMDHEKAAEFVKGKRVVVVGFGKTGLDIARECSSINGVEHPCTIVYRRDRWKIPDWSPWGISLAYLYLNRFSELLVHKPGEGFLLSLIATLLSPLRWGVSKLVESHIKNKLPLKKFDMVPEHSFSKDIHSSLFAYMPDAKEFFNEVERGSIKLKRTPSFSFYDKGIFLDDEINTLIEADIVIMATGFRGVDKLKDIFVSPSFRDRIAGSPRVPLYRWVASLLEGAFKLPSIKKMEQDISRWDEYMRQSTGEHHQRSSIATLEIWYNDQLCKDMGVNHWRKNGFWANLFQPYGPMDYCNL